MPDDDMWSARSKALESSKRAREALERATLAKERSVLAAAFTRRALRIVIVLGIITLLSSSVTMYFLFFHT